MTFGQRVKKYREEIGMSQDELAQIIGYKSRSSINKIELDKNEVTQTIICKLAKALKTTPGHLMGWCEPTSKTIEFNSSITNFTDHEIMVILAYRAHPAEQKAVDRILEIAEVTETTQKKHLLLTGQGGATEIEIKDPQGASEALKKLQNKHKK